MNNLKIGDTLVIHCYKHNVVIYESSRVAYVLDIKDDYIVLADENVLITKEDGINGRFKLFSNVNDGKRTYKKQTKKYKKSVCIRY